MKTIYQCEICNDRHDTPERAQACEAQGKGRQIVPTGTIMTLGSFYKGIVFAVAGGRVLGGHNYDYVFWACRPTAVGDSLGKEKCGAEFLSGMDYVIGKKPSRYYDEKELRRQTKLNAVTPKVRASAEYKRMRAWLKKAGIRAYEWDGKQLIRSK